MSVAEKAGLPEGTHPVGIRLRSANVERQLAFYQALLGFRAAESRRGITLSVPGGASELITLSEEPGAAPRPLRATGLFHLAIRYPDRASLATAVQRLLGHGYPIDGASDHSVSEAIYLSDPEGNGVELYADRPRPTWRWRGGQVQMGTVALDMRDLLATAEREGAAPELPAGTDLGHVHLHVPNLASADRFFHGWLGLDVTQRGYPGALFFSAGGYHHHVAANTWAGPAAPPANSVGLISHRLAVPSHPALDDLRHRLTEFDVSEITPRRGGLLTVRDPSGCELELAAEETRMAPNHAEMKSFASGNR
jgi:catechol 2,3-dioxygenase